LIDLLAGLLDAVPLAVIPVVLALLFFAAAQLGYNFHRRFGGTGSADDEGQVLQTALLVLALLLGFTFSMGLSSYDERRQQVVAEANHLRTAWLRASLVPAPHGPAIQATLAEYAGVRQVSPLPQQPERLAQAHALRARLWQQTSVGQAAVDDSQGASLVEAVTTLIETGTTRERAVAWRIPATVMVLLILFAIVSAFLLGYVLEAHGSRHNSASLVLFGLMGLVIMLILELDRPGVGTILVDQTAMEQVARQLAQTRPMPHSG
jgi:hypothetical protein